jgi:hypothetical protein
MTATEDTAVYHAEELAFEDTPIGDRQDRLSLISEAREIAADSWVVPFVGQVHVEEASTRLASSVAYAKGQTIRFAPNVMPRYVAVHEIAHIVHCRSKRTHQERSHGPEFRALYAALIAIVYGERYGRLLREAFIESGLSLGPAVLPLPSAPLIDIDRLADMTLGVRWL